MTTSAQWDNLIGSTAVDADGDKIGKVGQVYLNDATGQPEWVAVRTGLFGTRESFAPLYDAQPGDGELRLIVTKQMVKDAPSIDADENLGESEADALYQHYADCLEPAASQAREGTYAAGNGADYAGTARTGTEDAGPDVPGPRGSDVSGPTTDDAMTRSEERLHVGTETVSAGRARLRKYVVTENVTQTVPVSHEEVRLEREPITAANRDAAMSGSDITEEEHEVTLRAERPVAEKEAVPVERVRLGTETVTEERQVNEHVRKEQVDEPDVDADLRRDDR
jgi:uncharacterized protein (TIGR02271 family)